MRSAVVGFDGCGDDRAVVAESFLRGLRRAADVDLSVTHAVVSFLVSCLESQHNDGHTISNP